MKKWEVVRKRILVILDFKLPRNMPNLKEILKLGL